MRLNITVVIRLPTGCLTGTISRIDDFLADTLSPGQVAGFAKIVSYKFVIEADPIVALLKRGVSKTMFLEIESQDAGDGGSVA